MGEMSAIKEFTMPRGCQFVQIITAPRFIENYQELWIIAQAFYF